DTELMLADLQSVEGQLDKAKRLARGGDKEAKLRVEALERAFEALSRGEPVRTIVTDADDEAMKMLRSLQLLTAKKVLYVANVHEDDLHGEGELVQRVRERATKEGGMVVP